MLQDDPCFLVLLFVSVEFPHAMRWKLPLIYLRHLLTAIEYCPVKFWYNPFRFCISLIRYQAIFVTDYSLIHLKSNLLCSSEFTDFDSRYFWNWTDFQSYLDFMLVVWVVGAAITYLMLSVTWFMETVGFLAVFTEAMLGMFRKSTIRSDMFQY